MTTLSTSRKQRLRELEKEIREASDEMLKNGLTIGRYLCEIRDEELWKEDYGSWSDYLRGPATKTVGRSFTAAVKLIRAAEVAKRLPNRIDADSELSPSHLIELARLAPNVAKGLGGKGDGGKEKDYSQLRKQDMARVLKVAKQLSSARNPDKPDPSVRDVREAVDLDLGINRAAKAAETKREKNNGVDLREYIDGKVGVLEAIRENLEKIPDDGWKRFNEDNPRMVKRLTTACESLAAFLRKVL